MFESRSDDGLSGEVTGRKCVDIREEEEKEDEMREFYQHLIQQSQYRAMRSFAAGSRSEIPGQETMLHQYKLSLDLLDTDYMYCATSIYVTTCRETVPDQFNGRVVRMYECGLHASYVKLFDEDVKKEFKRTDLVHANLGDMLRGPAATLNFSNSREHDKILKRFISQENWMVNRVAQCNLTMMEDRVIAVHSRYWPLEMNEWITRRRLSGLPSRSIVKQVVQYGCDFVQVSHKLSADINGWRFSFSKAELIIIHSWTTSQRSVYRTLHTLNKMIKSRMKNSKLCTYYFKTLMLWSTEEKPAAFWSEHFLVNCVYELLCQLIDWLDRKFCPNYFIPTNNMIDHLTDTELAEGINALSHLLQNEHLIVDVLRTSRIVEAGNVKYYIKVPIWLYTSLLIKEQLDARFTRLFTKSSSVPIDRVMYIELSDIYYGLYYCIMAGHSLIQSDNYYLINSMEHFQCTGVSRSSQATVVVCCSTTVALNLIATCFIQYQSDTSESHSRYESSNAFMSDDSLNVLNVDNNQTDQKCLLYSQSIDNVDKTMAINVHFIQNIYGINNTTLSVYFTSTVDNKTCNNAEFYKERPGMSPTVNISWFINNAYLANLYYITLQDYRATEEMCDNIIHVSKQSYLNQWFAESSLPLILSTDWTSVYDKGLQAMLGLYSLCSFMVNKTDRCRCVRLGVCPVLFAHYLKNSCIVDQMDTESWDKCSNETIKHFKECEGDSRVHNGRRAVQASLAVIIQTFKQRLTFLSEIINNSCQI